MCYLYYFHVREAIPAIFEALFGVEGKVAAAMFVSRGVTDRNNLRKSDHRMSWWSLHGKK